MKRLLILVLLLTAASEGFCQKCSIRVVNKTSERMEVLSEKEVNDFLHTFDSSCSNNAEYSQYSNEVLFGVLEKYPQYCVNVLTNCSDIDREYIYRAIKSPIQEYDIQRIISAVKLCNKTNEVQRKIIAALEVAENEYR